MFLAAKHKDEIWVISYKFFIVWNSKIAMLLRLEMLEKLHFYFLKDLRFIYSPPSVITVESNKSNSNTCIVLLAALHNSISLVHMAGVLRLELS